MERRVEVKGLKEQIQKGQLGRLYLLYGEERFLVQLYEQRIKTALLLPEDEMMNLDVMQSPQDPLAIQISAETLPFMAERRVVIVKESGAFDTKAGKLAELAEWLKDVPESTTLVWIESKVDKRSKMYKAAQKNGYVVEFKRLGETELITWIGQELKRKGIQMDRNTASYFLSLTGNDMIRIQTELEKLVGYVKEQGIITREDVDSIVSVTIESSIFKLTDHLGNQQPAAAYRIYRQLIQDNEPVQRIFYMMIRQFRLLYKASLMLGADRNAVAKELGVPVFAAGNYQNQARRFGEKRLKELLNQLLDMDVATKTGEMDAEEAATLVILQYAKPQK